MAPTVEKHEKKKSSIRRLLSPVIFSSIGGGSSSTSSDHGRGGSHFRRRKTEQVPAATSPSSSSSSPSSPSTSLKYCKGRGTPPASTFRGITGRGGSSVETAFVGTTPAERARVSANVDQSCQRTSYGIPRRIIQRRQSTSSCGTANDDETHNKRAPLTPLYGSVINRVAADVQDGAGHNNYEDSYRHANAKWRTENGRTSPANTNHIVDSRNNHQNRYPENNRMETNECLRYNQTGSYSEVQSTHCDGRNSASLDGPYSQYYNRGPCVLSSPLYMASPATSPSPTEPKKMQNSTSNGNNTYATTRQWTAVVNERNEASATRCTTILRPQPLYTSTSSSGATAATAASQPRNVSPSGAAYGYAYVTSKNPSALPVPVAPSNPSQLPMSQQASFVRSGPHRRTVSECESTYSAVRREDTNAAPRRRPSTPTATSYECRVSKGSSSGTTPPATASVPIFKRGTLQSPPSLPPHKPKMDGTAATNTSPKKVTFPSSTASTAVYWPTRRGMTVDPPSRQSGQSNCDSVPPTGETGPVDVEAAYTAIYANTGANVSPRSVDTGDAQISPPTGTSASQQVAVPLSVPVSVIQSAHLSPQVLPQCCPAETSDYGTVSVAHSTPYIPHGAVGGRSYNSNSIQRHHEEGEAQYKQLEQQRYGQQEYGAIPAQRKTQPSLYDRLPHQQQVQQLRTRQLELNRREREYRFLPPPSESESGSEAGEIRKILHTNGHNTGTVMDKEVRKSHLNRREDPRRHTLSSGCQSARTTTTMFNSQNNVNVDNYFDLEPMSRIYPLANSTLFDDDPGIMSEVETSSTGFRRGNKQRSSLPIVRTRSKTLERPLGLVFLQHRHETKRSVLPNEITSLATVKALFVRSFPKQLTMEYLDSPRVRIYIHDSNKDMFYELEDHRSNLNEIRDHSVLRLFELTDTRNGAAPASLSNPIHRWNDPEPSYFSEPEFDSEFQHQHIHKNKTIKSNWAHQPYYLAQAPPGSVATLPHSGSMMRSFSPAAPTGAAISKSSHARLTPSLEKGMVSTRGYSPYSRQFSDDTCSSQYSSRASSTTPIIDEEASDTDILEDIYGMYSRAKLPIVTMAGTTSNQSATFSLASSAPVTTTPSMDTTRLRVEHMERQLASLTGLVQKALTQTLPTSSPKDQDSGLSSVSEVNFSDKSASPEKSVLLCEITPESNSSGSQPSPKFTEQERLKPSLAPKTSSSSTTATHDGHTYYGDLQLTPEMYNQLRGLQKKTKNLRHELRNLRRLSQTQAHSMKESVRDTFVKIRSMVLSGGENLWSGGADSERIRITHEEEIYKENINRLEEDLTKLESTVEELRSNVINRKTRVNITDVENMALVLSKSSKTVADLRLKFPQLQGAMKSVMSLEMQRVIAEET